MEGEYQIWEKHNRDSRSEQEQKSWYEKAEAKVQSFLSSVDPNLSAEVQKFSVSPEGASTKEKFIALFFSHASDPTLKWTLEIETTDDYIDNRLEQVVRAVYERKRQQSERRLRYAKAQEKAQGFLSSIDPELSVRVREYTATPADPSQPQHEVAKLFFSHKSVPGLSWLMEIDPTDDYIDNRLETVVRNIYAQKKQRSEAQSEAL